MSLYADYKKEREGKEVLETEDGFAVFSVLKDFIYIEDIYVVPEKRKTGVAASLADQICSKFKEQGFSKLVGSVDVTAKGSTDSFKVLLAYGMKADSVAGNVVYFTKDF